MPARRKIARKSRKPLRKVGKTMPKKYLGKMIRSIAKREVSKQIEDKEYITPITGDTPGGSPATFGNANFETNNIIDVNLETVNLITQANGLTEHGRIGNKIKLKSCVLRGVLYPSIVQNMATYVKIWVVSSRQFPNDCTITQMRSICGLSFFNTSPTSTNGGMTGQLIDLCRSVNDDQLQLYAQRQFKLSFSSAPNPGLNVAGNNDFKLSHPFRLYLGRHMNKNIIYNDADAQARNKKIFVVMECIPADGSVSNNNSYAVLNYFLDFKYEDA